MDGHVAEIERGRIVRVYVSVDDRARVTSERVVVAESKHATVSNLDVAGDVDPFPCPVAWSFRMPPSAIVRLPLTVTVPGPVTQLPETTKPLYSASGNDFSSAKPWCPA